MKRFGPGIALAAFIILMFQSAQVFGYADYDGWNNYYVRPANYPSSPMVNMGDNYSDSSDTSVNLSLGTSSYPAAVTITNPGSYTTCSGYADASRLSLGVSGYARSLGYNPVSAVSLYTSVANSFTVSPGTSGLSLGDTATLKLDIRLDGSVNTDAPHWPGSGGAWAEMSADFEIHDHAIRIDTGEGYYIPDQAWFGASLQAEAYNLIPQYHNKDYYAYRDDDWSMGSNISAETYGSYHSDSDHPASAVGGIPVVNPGSYHKILFFDVIVGHTLDLEADLSTLVQAYGTSESWCDYGHTFAFGLTPTVAGLQLDWDIPVQQTTTVPVPGALPLLGSGLLCLFGLRRMKSGR